MKRDDLSRSLVAFDQASTLIAVVELGLRSWLVAGLVPNLTRQPLKKLGPDPDALLRLVLRWRDQATKAGAQIKRMVVAFEAGRDGPVVASPRDRGLRDSRDQHPGVARTPAGEDGPARHRIIDASGSRLAPRRAEALQHGGDSDDCRGRCAASDPRA